MAWTKTGTGAWAYSRTATARELSYHEGGHAILLHEHGYKVIEIYIRPGAEEDAGATVIDNNVIPTPPSIQSHADLKDCYLRLASTWVAGVVAEHIEAGGAKPLPTFTWLHQRSDYLQVKAVFESLQDAEAKCNKARSTSYATDIDGFFDDACNQAYDVLTRRRTDLDAVASALFKKNRLDSADCTALLP